VDRLEGIAKEVSRCKRCRLHQVRHRAVPGEGPTHAKILVLGRNPGREEDVQGRPFVGRAGKFLDRLLNSAGLSREQVYITNPVKCFTPANRSPRTDEVLACKPFLDEQIRVLKPRLVVTLGNLALQVMLGERLAISRCHGKTFRRDKMLIFCTYHPAAGIRFPHIRKALEEDFGKLKATLARIPGHIHARAVSNGPHRLV
jgi:DNA polymerase